MRAVVASLAAAVLAIASAGIARADSITMTLNQDFGTGTGSGAPTVTFDDGGSTGTVFVTFDLTGLTRTTEYADTWFLNSSIDPTDTSTFLIEFQSGLSTGTAATGIQRVFDSTSDFKADGVGGYHDLRFDFENSNSADRFNQGEKVVYKITASGITASTFNMLGIDNNTSDAYGPYASAMHLCGTGTNGGNSTWLGSGTVVAVPEPGSIALLGMGIAGLGVRLSRRRRKAA